MAASLLVCPAFSQTWPTQSSCGPITICPYQTVTISVAPGAACTGFPEFSLESVNNLSYVSAYGCNTPNSRYFGPTLATECAQYHLREYCEDAQSCASTMQLAVSTAAPSARPTAAPTYHQGYLEVSKSQTCDGSTLSGEAPVGPCVPLYDSGRYGQFTCYGNEDSSAWTANIYLDTTCTTANLFQKLSGVDGCDCVPFAGTYMTYSMSYSCSSQPASCSSGSDGLSAAAIGGIAGGAAAAAIILVAVGLYVFGVFTCAPGSTTTSSATNTAADAESTANPIAAP